MSTSIRVSLQMTNGNLSYQSAPQAFNPTDAVIAKGPSPGAITVAAGGTDVDFSHLTLVGLCWIQNLSTTDYVTFGIWDDDNNYFYPLGEILAGEYYPIRLSRYLGRKEALGTGTGNSAIITCKLRFIPQGNANVDVRIDGFDS